MIYRIIVNIILTSSLIGATYASFQHFGANSKGRRLSQDSQVSQEPDSEESEEPSGQLLLSNDTLADILSASGISIDVDSDNPIALESFRNSLFLYFRVIIDRDQRKLVSNTQKDPFESVGEVGTYCTGTVIGARHVLTAAHCLVDPYSGRRYRNIKFTPARNGGNDPYGTFDAESVFFPDKFLDRNVKNFYQFDYGVITLKKRLPNNIKPIRIQNPCSSTQNYVLNIIGYPNDKSAGSQWSTACAAVWLNCGWVTFRHTCDTFGGMSGSAMMTARKVSSGTEYIIRGVHSGGQNQFGEPYNQGVIITTQVQNTINRIIRQSA